MIICEHKARYTFVYKALGDIVLIGSLYTINPDTKSQLQNEVLNRHIILILTSWSSPLATPNITLNATQIRHILFRKNIPG